MEELKKGHCEPCEGGIPPMDREHIDKFLVQVPEWKVEDDTRIIRDLTFKNFVEALDFVNKAGAIAEEQGHHPNLNIHEWNKVTVTLYTHKIGGLSMNDFIMAAKLDEVLVSENK